MTASRPGPRLKPSVARSRWMRRIFDRADALGLSLTELSARSGYEYNHLRKIRDGRVGSPRVQAAEDLAAAVGMDLA